MPPSWLSSVLRWKPVAICWSRRRVRAACRRRAARSVNWSNGMSALSASITQSRYFHIDAQAVLLVAVACRRSGRGRARGGPSARRSAARRAADRRAARRRPGACRPRRRRLPAAWAAGRSGRARRGGCSASFEASGEGCRPSFSSRARTNWSIGVRTQSVRETAGGGGAPRPGGRPSVSLRVRLRDGSGSPASSGQAAP